VLLVDPDIFDTSCLGMGECGLGYAVWECAGGVYAPNFFSGEVSWHYQNVTFIPLDCACDDFESLRTHREEWMSTNFVHSYEVYDSRAPGAVSLIIGSEQTVTPVLNPNPIHYVYNTQFFFKRSV
jgi:hypothetical protein